MHSANDRGPYREFPWALFLPPDEVPRFLADVAAAAGQGFEALEQTVTEWRHTAVIHADPELVLRLSEPVTGDHGAVPPPDQFDALMTDDGPDPAPKLAEVAQRARRFARREHLSPKELHARQVERLAAQSVAVRGDLARLLLWLVDELDAQASAHNEEGPSLDVLDHLRCFVVQPGRRGLIPWPEGLPRPDVTAIPDDQFEAMAATATDPEWVASLRRDRRRRADDPPV